MNGLGSCSLGASWVHTQYLDLTFIVVEHWYIVDALRITVDRFVPVKVYDKNMKKEHQWLFCAASEFYYVLLVCVQAHSVSPMCVVCWCRIVIQHGFNWRRSAQHDRQRLQLSKPSWKRLVWSSE